MMTDSNRLMEHQQQVRGELRADSWYFYVGSRGEKKVIDILWLEPHILLGQIEQAVALELWTKVRDVRHDRQHRRA